MKKLIRILLAAVLICAGGSVLPQGEVSAEEVASVDIDYSFLQTEQALVGHLQGQTRGVYLLDGGSSITKKSSISVGAGGSTSATRKCTVSVGVMVEQLNDGTWDYWTSWQVTEENSISVMTSRVVAVARGHYYRVRCVHTAETDTSSSWTGGLWM